MKGSKNTNGRHKAPGYAHALWNGTWNRVRMIVLCLLLAVCLSGCARTKTQGQSGRISKSRETGSVARQDMLEVAENQIMEPLTKVGFIQVGHESDWRVETTRRCKELFTVERGYQLYFVDADNRPKVQIRAARKLIQEGVDYILIDPIVPTGWTAVLKEAHQAGISVFILDRQIDCEPKYYRMWIGSDFEMEGRIAGEWLHSYLMRHGRASDDIRIVTIQGTAGSSAQEGRTNGFGEYVEENAGWTMVAEEAGDFTELSGRGIMQDYLENGLDFQVVVCQNDNMAIGACKALEEAGKSYGRDGEILVISFDATRQGLEAVLEGKINLDVECNPQAVNYAAQAIHTLEHGGILYDRIQVLSEDCFVGDDEVYYLDQNGMRKASRKVTNSLLEEREY